MAAPEPVVRLEPEVMRAAEDEARRLGRTTLFLDTRRGDSSEQLYQSLGWTLEYARSANGALDANAIYYRLLSPSPHQGRGLPISSPPP
ncbi:MAG TPA: hypothetical protein VFO18_15095 [Methylomirabilota bacterium]|nr:hypothetical protein [Methylomirabilota bacterium]